MKPSGVRVIKVGGSLIEYPSLADALTKWLAQQSPMKNLLVTGGGVWADEVRNLQVSGYLSDEAAHWLAIRCMTLTGWLLCQMLAGATIADQWEDLVEVKQESAPAVQPVIFVPERFLRQVEPGLPPKALPIGWHVTSDSIAARLAEILTAQELVLMKSTDPPTTTIERAAQDGLVDAYFPSAAAAVRRVRWVNLRRQPNTYA